MKDELKDEIQKEEKTFNILLIAVLSPILLGAVVITIYLFYIVGYCKSSWITSISKSKR